MAALWHTVVTPASTRSILEEIGAIHDGPVTQTQDLTVFNVTTDAVVVRQARVESQPQPVPGVPRSEPEVRLPADPDWWAEALIPLEDEAPAS
jgi:ribonuclease Z